MSLLRKESITRSTLASNRSIETIEISVAFHWSVRFPALVGLGGASSAEIDAGIPAQRPTDDVATGWRSRS
jgi:hypothetical protein